LTGLNKAPELNGKFCKITELNAKEGRRHNVQLDSNGRIVAVRPENLRRRVNPLRCSCGKMTRQLTSKPNNICDVCGVVMPHLHPVLACRACNYDVCRQCVEKKVREDKNKFVGDLFSALLSPRARPQNPRPQNPRLQNPRVKFKKKGMGFPTNAYNQRGKVNTCPCQPCLNLAYVYGKLKED